MKGVVLAGGVGSRLDPLTKATNKTLLPIGRYPMIYYPLSNMKQCGIQEIMIVTNRQDIGDFAAVFGSGSNMGLHIIYAVQEKPLGIVDALKEAKEFTKGDSMMLFLGDCIFEKPIRYFYEGFVNQQKQNGARVLLYEVPDPQRFGVATVEGSYITEIEEKPQKPKSNLAVVGAYLYDSTAWDKIPFITPSARGEYEITTLNNMYMHEHSLQFDKVQGKWFDAGTFQSMLDAGTVMMKAWDASE